MGEKKAFLNLSLWCYNNNNNKKNDNDQYQLSLPGGKIVRWQKTAKLPIPCHDWQFAIAVKKQTKASFLIIF